MTKGITGRRLTLFALIAALAALTLTVVVSAASAQPGANGRDRLLVGFDKKPGAAERDLVGQLGGEVSHAFPSVSVLAVSLPSGKAAELARHTGVRYVEEDAPRYASSLSNEQLVPSLDNGLWGLVQTKGVDAQQAGYSGGGAMACVADSGIDANHRDIAANYLGGVDEIGNDSNPDVGNDLHEQHATHVAGTLAGVNNNYGIIGMAPANKFFVARVLGWNGTNVVGTSSQVMAGAQWLSDHGCRLINMSLGAAKKLRTEEAFYNDLFTNGAGGKGTLVVAAAGNEADRNLAFPAGYSVVLSVAAVDRNNQLASFSNTGQGLDISAPGVDVLSSVPNDTGHESSVQTAGGMLSARAIEFAGGTSAKGLARTLVNCGLAGSAADCPAGVRGNIALIQRGTFGFAQKVTSAMDAGAVGAIIYNNVAGNFNGTLGTDRAADGRAWIPAVSISQADGQTLVAQGVQSVTLFNVPTSWDTFSGTSMATPHVTGAAALALAANKNLTPAQLTSILQNTATDLGAPGYDNRFGYGLVNALAAANLARSTP